MHRRSSSLRGSGVLPGHVRVREPPQGTGPRDRLPAIYDGAGSATAPAAGPPCPPYGLRASAVTVHATMLRARWTLRSRPILYRVGQCALVSPCPPEDVLAAIATGLWRWDNASGTVTLDAEAARLLGLPAEPATLTEAAVRSRFHPVDWNEINGVVQPRRRRGHPRRGPAADHGRRTAGCSVPSAAAPSRTFDPARRTYELIGTIQEVAEPSPGTAAARTAVTGDWRRSREAFLLDAGRALAEARSTAEVLRVAASLSMPGFSPDGLAVFGVDGRPADDHRPPRAPARATRAPSPDMPLDTDYPAAEVVRTGRAVYLSSPEDYKPPLPRHLAARPALRPPVLGLPAADRRRPHDGRLDGGASRTRSPSPPTSGPC